MMGFFPRYALSESVAPSVEPVSVAELERHLRLTAGEENSDDLTAFLKTARRYVEDRTMRATTNTTYVMYLEAFPDVIYLPRSPVSSITSITYVDPDGATQTESASKYRTDLVSEPARIENAYGETFSVTRSVSNAVAVTFVAGYGATAASVPDGLRTAIKMLAAHYFEHREAVEDAAAGLAIVPMAVDSLIAHYRVGVL